MAPAASSHLTPGGLYSPSLAHIDLINGMLIQCTIIIRITRKEATSVGYRGRTYNIIFYNMFSRHRELYRPFIINKYVKNTCHNIQFKKIFYSEIETTRRLVCDRTGKTAAWDKSSFSCDSSEDGQIKRNICYKDYPIFSTVSSLKGSPYSVSICNESFSVDFQAGELDAVYAAVNKIIDCANEQCDCSSCNYIDIPVWGGGMKLRLSLIGGEGFILGFTITQINPSVNKAYIRQSGYSPKILPAMSKMCIYVDVDRIRLFGAILSRTHQVMRLQLEIMAQQYAICELVPQKWSQRCISNREELYWLVLEIFYGLHVGELNRLPASFVLRDFLLLYLCDKYALYYNPSCVCNYYLRHMPNTPCPGLPPPYLY